MFQSFIHLKGTRQVGVWLQHNRMKAKMESVEGGSAVRGAELRLLQFRLNNFRFLSDLQTNLWMGCLSCMPKVGKDVTLDRRSPVHEKDL